MDGATRPSEVPLESTQADVCASRDPPASFGSEMHRFMNLLAALSLVAGLSACGGGYSGFVIPQETKLKPWVVPSADELIPEEEEEDSGDDADSEDYEDEEDAEAAPAAPAVPAAAPAKSK